MPAIHVTPVGFESLGVRSMCTFVETPDVRLLIDAGVALGPRLRRLPHPREYVARNECRTRIRSYAAKADVIVISHYHNDHNTPNYTENEWLGSSAEEAEQIYQGKTVLTKDVRNAINFNQRRRGWMFQRFVKRIGSKCETADGKSFDFGATKVTLSQPVPHGEESSDLGWVLMTCVRSGEETFLHASDVQGPMSKETTRMIIKEKPDCLVLGGPPTYLEGIRVDQASIRVGMQNAATLASKIPIIVFEHHILRSEKWREQSKSVYDSASSAEHEVMTAAEYLKNPPMLLESQREKLYEEEVPSREFVKWTELHREKRRLQPPPV